jgi:hypothetical protein
MWLRRVRENLKKGGGAAEEDEAENCFGGDEACCPGERTGRQAKEKKKKKKHASQVAPLIPGFTHRCRCLSLDSVGLVCHVSILYWFVRRLISRGAHVKQLLSSLM